MRIPNEPKGTTGGAFGDLIRLQTEFQTRLAEETLQYLRHLQGVLAPAAPGTVLASDQAFELTASGVPGGSTELLLEVENCQRVHSVVTPMLSPLVSASGTTWFPAAEPSPPAVLLAPDEAATLRIGVPLPLDLPEGVYRGALLLPGFREGAIGVAVTISKPPKRAAPPRRKRARPAAGDSGRGSAPRKP